MPLSTDETLLNLSRNVVEAFDKADGGIHPGFRPAHAKGILLTGLFTPSLKAPSLMRAPHIQRNSTPVMLRFSDFAGIPTVSDNDPQNARRLLDAIEGIIGHRPDISVEQLSQPRKHVRFQNDGLKIDLLTSVRDHDFQEAFKGRETMLVGSKEIPVVSKAVLLQIKQTVAELGGNTKYEIYDYPGIHTKKSEGDTVTKIRMEEEEALHHVISGSGNCRSFAPGYKFNLDEHSRRDMNGDYLLTEVTHSASVGDTYSGSGDDSQDTYTNHFTCIPFAVPYRPQRLTPKPIVQGPQTAVVVGPAGEEIYPDKYGRVKVQFHWDRLGKKDENSSCWVRVSQPWAGKNWGAINIPRINQEVIVEFLEGDPDRPIITGRVYNDDQMPPYTLPDNMTRTTFMSRSTKSGGSANYNELRFEDKKGNEQIFLNAEKDMDHRVENDSREFIGNDRHLIVKNDQKEKVQGEQHIQIVKDRNEKVGGDASLEVTGNQNDKVGQNMSLQVGQNLQEKSGQNYAHEAGMAIHLKAGMNVVIEAGLELTIKASGGFINIGPAGVAISGTLVLINSGGAAGSGSGSSPTSPKAPKDPDQADDGSKGGKM